MVAEAAKPPGRTIRFYGANRELFGAREDEVLLSGPAGTGKSIACLTKLFLFAEKYPGSRLLIVRKTRDSLTEAGLVTWENEVVPRDHPCLAGPQRRFRQNYQFPNGSEVAVGGLDKSQKIMSTAFDMIYVQEAIELQEGEWEDLTTRLRKRKNDDGAPSTIAYRQIIADTNPDRPTHWLKRRCDRGATRMLESRHEDNPSVIDRRTGQATPDGAKYLSKLDALTGPRKPRLRYGRWVQAEGVVYDKWDSAVHLIDRFPIPAEWPRFLSVDFGFTNPFVCGWFAMDPDGRLYLYREIYRTGRLVSDHGIAILRAVGAVDPRTGEANWHFASEPAPSMVICDHDAEDRATLARAIGLYCAPADKAVALGIQSVNERLTVQPDGKPRLFVLRDSLIDRDEKLVEAGHPTCLVEEFDSYVWAKSVDGRPVKEEPVKMYDHACLVAGTMITTDRGEIAIENVRPGCRVWTRGGWKPVLAAGLTSYAAEVHRVEFDNGSELIATANHPIWTEQRGFARVDELAYDAITLCIGGSACRSLNWNRRNGSSGFASMASSIGDIRYRENRLSGITSGPDVAMRSRAGRRFTATYGSIATATFPTASKSTIGTVIRSTTAWRIFNYLLRNSTPKNTEKNLDLEHETDCSPCHPNSWPNQSHECGLGIQPRKAANGTANTGERSYGTCLKLNCHAINAERFIALKPSGSAFLDSVTSTARWPLAASPARITKNEYADAGKHSPATSISRPSLAPARVVSVKAMSVAVPVFNLTVKDCPEFFANGVLVHNCDSLRYLCHTLATRGFHPLTPTSVSTGGGGEFGDELRRMAGPDRDGEDIGSLFDRMTN